MRHACGCTMQSPAGACSEGRDLYATAARAFQDLFQEKAMIASEERWIIYGLARLAYLDHLNGWREGDVKVQRRAGYAMVFTRFSGQWMFQFGTKDEAQLLDWLRNRGYQQYVQVKSEQPADQLLGYYRLAERAGKDELSPAPVQRGSGTLPTSALLMDLTIQVAIHIACVVAGFARPLTIADRLSVQQRATRLLQEQGRVMGPREAWMLQEMIDEAIRQKERLNSVRE